MQNDSAAAIAEPRPAAASSPTYTLVVLTLVYVVNYLDRQILGILNVPIKAEFHLTNFEVGLLNGPAFALIYATLGIPIAVIADRVNRRNVIAVSLLIFSTMTILCGYAVHFWQLLLARFGTGIGEAGTTPSIAAILADLYPRERRAAALSFYSAGLNVGLLLAFFGGGWIAEVYGWRNTFLVAGIPGFALALLLLVSVREPVRGQVEQLADRGDVPNLWDVVAHLGRQRSFVWFSIGTSLSSFAGYSAIVFVPIFLRQTHHMSLPAIGLVFGILTGVVGACGTWVAGVLADRLGRRDARWNMYVPIIATFVTVPFGLVFYFASNTVVALSAATVPALTATMYVGPCYAMAQALVPPRMRARTGAILLFILNVIGLGLAVPLVGKVSDVLTPIFGAADALRYALLLNIVAGLAGAFCYWRASRTLREEIARVGS